MRRLAISTWTLHGQLQGDLALLDLPSRIAQRGIHALEICHFHLPSTTPAYLAELKAACRACATRVLGRAAGAATGEPPGGFSAGLDRAPTQAGYY